MTNDPDAIFFSLEGGYIFDRKRINLGLKYRFFLISPAMRMSFLAVDLHVNLLSQFEIWILQPPGLLKLWTFLPIKSYTMSDSSWISSADPRKIGDIN